MTIPLTVPEIPGGKSDEPLDLSNPASPNASGTNPLDLKEYKNVRQSDPAPA